MIIHVFTGSGPKRDYITFEREHLFNPRSQIDDYFVSDYWFEWAGPRR